MAAHSALAYLLVAAGSAIGGVLRYVLAGVVDRNHATAFPLGTFAVNVLGSFAIGVLLGLIPRDSNGLQAFAVVGVLGGFTTFSAFSAQTVGLLRTGATGLALGYVLLSVVICVAATFAGAWVTRA